MEQLDKVRTFAATSYAATSWNRAQRVVARIVPARKGADTRFFVTNLKGGSAQHSIETVYCARGQGENLIERHNGLLAFDRTSCRSPRVNQMRLILHTEVVPENWTGC